MVSVTIFEEFSKYFGYVGWLQMLLFGDVLVDKITLEDCIGGCIED